MLPSPATCSRKPRRHESKSGRSPDSGRIRSMEGPDVEWGRVLTLGGVTLGLGRVRTEANSRGDGKRRKRGTQGRGLGRQTPHAVRAHSPHPAVGFAVGRVYADGSLTVLHGPCVVPQFAVGRRSGETKRRSGVVCLARCHRGASASPSVRRGGRRAAEASACGAAVPGLRQPPGETEAEGGRTDRPSPAPHGEAPLLEGWRLFCVRENLLENN